MLGERFVPSLLNSALQQVADLTFCLHAPLFVAKYRHEHCQQQKRR